MDRSEALAFIAQNSRGVLATTRRDGSPQISPIVASVDEDGCVVISTREPAMKVRNLRRNPVASLCMFPDAFFGPWVQVDGRVEIVSLPEAMDGLVAQYRRLRGEHRDWDEYRDAMNRERRVLLRLTVERAGPNARG